MSFTLAADGSAGSIFDRSPGGMPLRREIPRLHFAALRFARDDGWLRGEAGG